MSKPFIRLGSIVVDKATGQALRVIDASHQTADEHQYVDVPDLRQWGVTEGSTVYECVYLPTGTEDDNAYPPRQTYAFPEEQLFRFHCEHALPEGARRIHTQIIEEVIADILLAADVEGTSVRQNVELAISQSKIDAEVPPGVLLEEAAELAEASIGPEGDADV